MRNMICRKAYKVGKEKSKMKKTLTVEEMDMMLDALIIDAKHCKHQLC